MPEPRKGSPNNIVSLKEYVDTRFCAADRATAIAVQQMERRLESMNEFRDALKDQASRLATRQEMEVALKAMEAELRGLRDFRVALEAKASQQSVNVSLLLALIGLALSIIGMFR